MCRTSTTRNCDVFNEFCEVSGDVKQPEASSVGTDHGTSMSPSDISTTRTSQLSHERHPITSLHFYLWYNNTQYPMMPSCQAAFRNPVFRFVGRLDIIVNAQIWSTSVAIWWEIYLSYHNPLSEITQCWTLCHTYMYSYHG